MIINLCDLDETVDHDICVLGAGPIGLALSLSCAEHGLKVLLLESGPLQPDAFHNDLGSGSIRNDAAHVPLEVANCRALGGTSHWWGGRCVPLDTIDFETRPHVPEAVWPINYAELAQYYARAAAFFRCGPAVFSAVGPWQHLVGLKFDELERWCPDPNMGRVHAGTLETSRMITVVLGATVNDMGFTPDRDKVTGVTVTGHKRLSAALPSEDPPELITRQIPTTCVVVACGGVQTPRLLLALQRRNPQLFGGADGPLGRYYMGHIAGKIADVILDQPQHGTALDFYLEGRAFARRRFTLPPKIQSDEALLNISFAAGNARIMDPSHRNGALSLIWLTLASPFGKRLLPAALRNHYVGSKPHPYWRHLWNVIRTAIPTALAGVGIVRDRYIRRPGKPAVFLWSGGGRYSLFYQSEQTPCSESRVTLTREDDPFGVPRADIDFHYFHADADQVVRAHEVLDRALRTNSIGRLEFNTDRSGSIHSVLEQARDGMHQIGAARMSDDPSQGVVDRDCRVHGLSNLFLASTAVFPSSGHANPTFAGTALALRLSDLLATEAKRSGTAVKTLKPLNAEV